MPASVVRVSPHQMLPKTAQLRAAAGVASGARRESAGVASAAGVASGAEFVHYALVAGVG